MKHHGCLDNCLTTPVPTLPPHPCAYVSPICTYVTYVHMVFEGREPEFGSVACRFRVVEGRELHMYIS